MFIGYVAVFTALATSALVHRDKEALAGDQVDCSKLKDIKAFCQSVEGKEASIKRVMKDAEKAYEKAGKGELKCQSCHEGANGGALTGDATKLWPAFKPFVETAITNYKK